MSQLPDVVIVVMSNVCTSWPFRLQCGGRNVQLRHQHIFKKKIWISLCSSVKILLSCRCIANPHQYLALWEKSILVDGPWEKGIRVQVLQTKKNKGKNTFRGFSHRKVFSPLSLIWTKIQYIFNLIPITNYDGQYTHTNIHLRHCVFLCINVFGNDRRKTKNKTHNWGWTWSTLFLFTEWLTVILCIVTGLCIFFGLVRFQILL